MRFATIFFVTSFIVGSLAGPLTLRSETECSITCDGSSNKFDYELGTTYEYEYEAETVTALRTDGQDSSRLRIRATAQVTPTTKCDFTLKLRNVRLDNGGPAAAVAGEADFRLALERAPLKFSYADGRIEHLCPTESEPIWVLNIKRGVLSMFQNAMPNFEQDQTLTETDVTGQCETRYSVGRAGWLSGEISIHKTKDLSDCSRRTDHYTSLQFNPYHPQIARKSEALVKSTHQCDQIIKHGNLISATCAESHAFQPFSNEKTGAVTNGTQKLNFIRSEKSKPFKNAFIQSRVPLSFDHKYKEFGQTAQPQQAEEALRDLCRASQDDIRPEVPRLFSRLVHRLQELKTKQLYTIYKNVEKICPTNTKAKKLFFDAVPLTGSEAGVELMRDLILRQEISTSEVDTWMLMLGFFPRPTKQMIASLMPLMDPSVVRPKTLLGISTLTHSYCKTNMDCQQEPEIRNLVKHLSASLGEKCASVGEQQKETIAITLKALGNIGYIKDALPILTKCYKEAENPIEIRLAAIDALRRLPCSIDKDELLSTFLNLEEDSEVRIAAYLSIMKCPTPEIMVEIHRSLETEVVNQVGSFVWTHLTSVQETSDPCKRDIKKILSSNKLQKKFSTDVRKFSRYYEGSLYLDSLNTGSHVDGTVVFSPKSYLPRSSSLGLTLDIFGESINLLEVGGRAEGFEHLVESFFGPKGYFPDDTIQKILESARDKQSYDQTKLNEIARIFNVKHSSEQEPHGSFYMRVFGNDLLYTQFANFEQLVQRANPIDAMGTLMRLLQNEDAEYTKSFVMLDSSLIVPTGAGLPLNLTLNGTATVNLRVGGKLDLTRMRTNSFDVRAHIQPSASVEIASSMVVDAFVFQSGLKMVATAHTSIQADGELTVNGGELVKARINMPKERMDIFDIESRVYLLGSQGQKPHASLVAEQNHVTACSGSAVSKYLGVEMCAEMEFPGAGDQAADQRPAFLFSGPVAARAYLRKTDKTMESYNFEYRWDKQEVASKTGLKQYVRTGLLLLDTPKSTVNRQVKAEFKYDEADKTIALTFVSPIKQLSLRGQVNNDPELKKLELTVTSDQQEKLSLTSELRVEKDRLQPRLTLRLLGEQIVDFSALVARQLNGKCIANMDLVYRNWQPIAISGAFDKSGIDANKRYEIDLLVKSTPLNANSKWFLQLNNAGLTTKATVEYRLQSNDKQLVTFSGKYQRQSSDDINLTADFQSTAAPKLNWEAALRVQKKAADTIHASLALSHGPTGDSTRFLYIQFERQWSSQWPEHKLNSKLSVQFLPANVDTTVELKSQLAGNNLDTSLQLRYGADRELTVTGGFERGATPTEIARGFVRLASSASPDHVLEFSGNLARPQPKELMAVATCRWNNANEAKLALTLRKTADTLLGHEIYAELVLPGQKPIVVVGDVLMDKTKSRVHGEAHLNGAIYSTYAEYQQPSIENVRLLVGSVTPYSTYNAQVDVQNGKNDKYLTTNFDMGNDHRVTTDIRIKRDKNRAVASAELKMDATKNPEDSYDIHVDLNKPISGSEGVITLHCPARTVGVKWNFSNDVNVNQSPSISHSGHYEVWWNVDSKIAADLDFQLLKRRSSREVSGTMKLATPFYGMQNVVVEIGHNDDGSRFTSKGLVQWNGAKALLVTSTGKFQVTGNTRDIQSTIKLESSLMVPKELTIQFDHKLDGYESQNNVALQWAPNHQVQFQLGTTDESDRQSSTFNYKGTLNITSSFSWPKDIYLAGKITNKDKLAMQLEVDYEQTHIMVELEGNLIIKDNKTDAYFGVHLMTPFANYENLSSSLRLNKDISSLTTAADFSWLPDKRIAVEVTAAQHSSVAQRNSVLSLHLLSPFQHFEDVLLTITNVQKRNQFRYDLEVKWSPEATFTTQLEYSMNLPQEAYVKVEVQEPFKLFNQFTSDVRYSFVDQKLSMSLKGVLDSDTIQMSTSITKVPHDELTHTYYCLVDAVTPFSSFKSFHLKLDHKCQYKINKHDTNISATYNGVQSTITHSLRFVDMADYEHHLQMNLPLANAPLIRLSNIQTREQVTWKHKSELSWNPENVYGVESNTKLLLKPNNYFVESDIKINTPAAQYGPFKALLSHEKTIKNEHQTHFMIEYWPGQVIDLSSEFQIAFDKGNYNFILQTPFETAKSIVLDGTYKVEHHTYTGASSIEWQDDKKVELSFVIKHYDHEIEYVVNVNTPWQTYEKNSLKISLDGHGESKTGNVIVTIGDRKIEASLVGKKNENNGEYVFTISTPISGFETTSISSNYMTSPMDNSISITIDNNLGNFQLNVFHNIRTNSMDSGVTFKSPIVGLEDLTIGSHFDSSATGKQALLSVDNGKFKANMTARYQKTYDGGFLNIDLNTPISEFKTVKFDATYALTTKEAALNISASQNGKQIQFQADLKGSLSESEATVTLLTPFYSYENLAFNGKLNINDVLKSATVTVSKNELKSTLSSRIMYSPKAIGFGLEFNSPIDGIKSFKLLGNYKLEASQIHTSLVMQQEEKTLDISAKFSINPQVGHIIFAMKTPITDFRFTTINVNYDVLYPKKQVKISIQKDSMKASIESELETTVNGVDGKISASTSFVGYENLMFALKTSIEDTKHIYTISSQSGMSKYQATWELTSSPGHLASNVIVKTPGEDAMLYTQYNFNGANSINFDAKLMRQKTMIELSGRFWRQPGFKKVDASLTMNSNYKKMTAMTSSVHYISGDNKEFQFQTEYNGQRNEIKGSLTQANDGTNVLISGSTQHPDWKTFSVIGNVKASADTQDKLIKLLLKKNDKNIEITGSLLDQETILLSTSISGYESITIQASKKMYDSESKASFLMSKGQANLLSIIVSHSKQNAKILFNVDIISDITEFKTLKIKSVFHSDDVIADITTILDEKNVQLTLTGHANVSRGDINLIINSNTILPYLNAQRSNLKLKYDSDTRYLNAAAQLDDDIYKLNIQIEKRSAELVFESPATPKLKISTKYQMTPTIKDIEFSIISGIKSLASFQLDLQPNTGKIQFELNFQESPLSITAAYSVKNNRRNISFKFQKSGIISEINGYTFSRKQNQNLKFETQFTMTSPLKGLEFIKFESLYNSKEEVNFETSLKWTTDKEIKFIFNILPESAGITTTLTTPFEFYETLSFTVNHKVAHGEYSAGMSLEWSAKRIAMLALVKKDQISVTLSSPFDGIEDVKALLSFGMEPMKASLFFKLNPNFVVEINANVNLQPQIGKWILSVKLPIIAQGSYVFQGQYDFTKEHVAQILAEGSGQKFEVKMQCKDNAENNSRQFILYVLTPMEHFQHLLLDATYSTTEGQNGAYVNMQFNNREYKFVGTTTNKEKTVSLNAQLNTPIAGIENVNIDAKSILAGPQKSANLDVQVGDKSVMSFNGVAKINLPSSLNVNINLVSANAQLNNVAFIANYKNQEEIELDANFKWNPESEIKFESKVSPKNVFIDIVTPFAMIRNIRITNKLSYSLPNMALNSAVIVNSDSLRFNLMNTPQKFETNLKIETSAELLSNLNAELVLEKSEQQINSKLTFEMNSLPKMELQFDLQNSNFEKISATLQFKLPQSSYSIEGVVDNDKTGNVAAKITIRTPHEKYTTSTITVNTIHTGLAKNEIAITMTLPTTKHTLGATLTLSPENITFNALFESDCVKSTPASFVASLVRDSTSSKLVINANTKDTKRSLNWLVDKSSATQKGQITYLSASESTSDDYKWSANYLSNVQGIMSKDTPITFYLNVNHESTASSNDFEALTISLDHSAAHTMNAKVTMKYAKEDHYFLTSYSIQGTNIDGVLELSSPRLPFKTASLKTKLTNKDALLKFVFDKTTNVFSANYKVIKDGYEATFKVEAPTLRINEFIGTGKFALGKNNVDATLNVQAKRIIHSLSVSLKRQAKEMSMQIKLKTPLLKINTFILNGRVIFTSLSNVDATLSLTLRRIVHTLALRYKLNAGNMQADFKLQTPLIDAKEISIHVELANDRPSNTNGEFTLIAANSEHSGKFNVACEHQETSGTLEIKSPLLSTNSILLKSSLVRKDDGEVTASAAATLPSGTHKVDCKLHGREDTGREMELKWDSPLIPSGPYALIVKFDQQLKKKSILLTLVTPKDVHSVQYDAQKNDEALILQGTLKTPLFNIDTVTMSAKIYRVSLKDFKIALGLETTKHNHALEAAVQLKDKLVEFQVKLDTTFLDIGSVSSKGVVNIVSKHQINVDMSVTTPQYTHVVKGDFQVKDGGMLGNIRVDTPYWDTIDVQASVQKISDGKVQLLATAKTSSGNLHQLRALLKHGAGSINTDVKINSPLLPCKQFQLTANITLKTPLIFNGDFAVQTPGQSMRVAGNYHNNPQKSIEAGVTLETSFDALPVLKMNGRLARPLKSAGFDGAFELHTDNYGDPKVALYYKYEMDNGRLSEASITIHTPFEGYETMSTKYGSKQQHDSPKTLIFTFNRFTYGYEIKHSKSAGGRNIHLTIFVANKQYAFGATTQRRANRIQIDASLVTPIKHLEKINFGLLYDIEAEQTHNFQVSISGKDYKYGAQSEFSMTDKRNFRGVITLETSISGYEKTTLKVQQVYTDTYWRYSLEQISADQPNVVLLLENTHQGASGHGKLQLTTSLDNLKTADIFYKYDHVKDAQVDGQVGVSHNGRRLLDINTTTSKDGGRVVEIINPIQPITVQYTYTVTGEQYPGGERTVSVEAVMNWLKSDRKVESTIGFNARVSSKAGYRQIVVQSIHPVLPIRLIFLQETATNSFVQRGELKWDTADFSSVSYELRTLNTVDVRNVTARLSLPIRAFELSAQSSAENDGARAAAIFKWDASRDESKRVGIAIEHGIFDNEHRAAILVEHPKLEKALSLRGVISSGRRDDLVFLGRLELDYSRDERQKLSMEAKVTQSSENENNDQYSAQLIVTHPVSKTDIQLVTEMANNSRELSAGFKLSYMDREGQIRRLELRSKIVKLQKQIQITLKSTAAKLQMSAQLKALESGYLISATSQLNDQSPISADLQLVRGEGTMADFTIVYDPNNRMKMRVGLANPKTILMEKYQTIGPKRIQDMKFVMQLNNSREVVTTFKWQPGSLKQLEDDLIGVLQRTCMATHLWMKEFSAFAAVESAAKYQILKASVDQSLHAAVTELKTELVALAKDSAHMQQTMHRMYEKNTFYLRDIIDGIVEFAPFRRLSYVLASSVEDLVDALSKSASSIGNGFNQFSAMCRVTCSAAASAIGQRIQDLPYAILHYSSQVNAFSARAINSAIAGAMHIGREVIFYCVPQLREWQKMAPVWISRISNEVTVKLQEYVDTFFNNRYSQQLKTTLSTLVTAVQDAFNYEYWGNMWTKYSSILERVTEYALSRLDHPYLSAITIASENAYNLGVWGYNFLKVEDRARDMLNVLIARAEDILMYVIQETIVPDYELPNIANHIVFDPKSGRLEITQKLPVAWNSFTEAPKIYDSPEYHQMIQASSKLGQLPYESVKNLVHAVKSEFTWNNMVPSFRGRAMLVNNQHYVTFDGRFYEFAGDCSYLLAHDFVDNNFTAVVIYNTVANSTSGTAANTTTFLLILDGRRITIESDLRVAVDGQAAQLPLTTGATRIELSTTGTGNGGPVLTVSNAERQVWLSYGSEHRVLMLEVGGFYHGKTAGLFGSYDHEPFDDFRKPDRKTAATVEDFAASWEVGSGQCPTNVNRAHQTGANSFAVQKPCNDIFTGYNTMTLCTRKINPQPYRNMCANDVASGSDPCGAAAAYVTMCRASGYEVTIPEKCLQQQQEVSTVDQPRPNQVLSE